MNPYTPNFLQSDAWAKTNKLIGHKVIQRDDLIVNSPHHQQKTASSKAKPQKPPKAAGKHNLLMIVKSARRGRYLEVPGAPQGLNFDKIRQIAREEHCVFVRFRFQLPNTTENRHWAAEQGLKPAPMHLHAEHTVIIDLSKSEDDLLAAMRRQTRYEVRRSAKLGITVEKSHSEAIFQEFYRVQQETAARQHFIPPSQATLLAEHQAFGSDAPIYIAKSAEGEPIAYGLILKSAPEAAYFEAASTPLGRKLPGAYALLWQAMCDLKAEGYDRFNLWGIAPEGQPHHRYAGVTTFKTGFGGEIVEFLPAQDLIINHLCYLPDLVIETIRKKKRHLA